MSTKISVSFRDHVWESWIKDYSGNVSAFIEENFIKGVEIEVAENYKRKYIEMVKENASLCEEIKKLKANIGRLEATANPQTKLTPDELYTDEELDLMKQRLKNNPFRLNILKNAIRIIDRDYGMFEGQFRLYNNETGDNLSIKDYNKMIVMFRKIQSEEAKK